MTRLTACALVMTVGAVGAVGAGCGSGGDVSDPGDGPDAKRSIDAGQGQPDGAAAGDAPPASACSGGGGPGTFTCTGSLGTRRIAPGVAPLPGGKALVAGGWNATSGTLSTAEVFDSASGTFSSTGNMATGHLWSGWATSWPVLANGKVLVAGGLDAAGSLIGGAELYDPAAGAFAATGPLVTAAVVFFPTVLEDGSVLFTGGYDAVTGAPPTPGWFYTGAGSSQAQRYDPGNGTFASAGTLGGGRLFGCNVRLASGEVLAIGGWRGVPAAFESSIERYNRGTNAWTTVGTLPDGAQCGANAYLLPNGKVLLGIGQLYDPVANTVTATVDGSAAWQPIFAQLTGGDVLAAGGRLNGAVTTNAAVYRAATNTWTPVGSLHLPRDNDARAVVLGSGDVLIVGGSNGDGPVTTAEIYHP